jgi:dCTP deaminase
MNSTLTPAGPIPDRRIRELAQDGMIHPFEASKVRHWADGSVISYGCSSYGYDLRLDPQDFRVFRHVPGMIVDPKQFDDRCLASADLHHDENGHYFILPAHSYALGVVIERLVLPPNVTAIFIGKSTYARCGVIVNLTPGEAGWQGYLTLEISNSSGADCRIYANEGICQALFFEGAPCGEPYGDGKYQNQSAGVTVARI